VRTHLLILLCLVAAAAQAGTVDFDSISATCCFADVTPGTGRGPFLNFGWMTIDGGVVMNSSGWAGKVTTAPNLYGTADSSKLADDSLLPGFITMAFPTPISGLGFDIINGSVSSYFTATAYDALLNVVDTDVVELGCFECSSGAIGGMTLTGDISRVIVTSGQGAGYIDFAVDTIVGDGAVPEPGTFGLFIAGGIVAVLSRWRARRIDSSRLS
jgi:hypothetical protein